MRALNQCLSHPGTGCAAAVLLVCLARCQAVGRGERRTATGTPYLDIYTGSLLGSAHCLLCPKQLLLQGK